MPQPMSTVEAPLKRSQVDPLIFFGSQRLDQLLGTFVSRPAVGDPCGFISTSEMTEGRPRKRAAG